MKYWYTSISDCTTIQIIGEKYSCKTKPIHLLLPKMIISFCSAQCNYVNIINMNRNRLQTCRVTYGFYFCYHGNPADLHSFIASLWTSFFVHHEFIMSQQEFNVFVANVISCYCFFCFRTYIVNKITMGICPLMFSLLCG